MRRRPREGGDRSARGLTVGREERPAVAPRAGTGLDAGRRGRPAEDAGPPAGALSQVHSISARVDGAPCEVVGRFAHPRLRPYVLGYAGFRAAPGRAPLRRILPLNLATVIIDFTGTGSLITGPRATAAVYERPAWRYGVSIGLTPAGAYALLGTPMGALAGAAVPPDDLLGRRAARLADRLAEAPGWAARFAALEDELGAWIRPDRASDDMVTRAWWRLQGTDGPATIGRLAGELGVSRRFLETGFQRRIGLPPKTVARIARFQRAIGVLARPDTPIAAAVGCGYADQPHLTREVRALAGLTPGELCAFLQYAVAPAD